MESLSESSLTPKSKDERFLEFLRAHLDEELTKLEGNSRIHIYNQLIMYDKGQYMIVTYNDATM